MLKRPALILRVMAALSGTKVSEDFIEHKNYEVHGVAYKSKRRGIVINPVHAVVDTVIHELLHTMHPEWKENYVRNRTSFLMNRLTDEERQVIYEEYLKKVKVRPEWLKALLKE